MKKPLKPLKPLKVLALSLTMLAAGSGLAACGSSSNNKIVDNAEDKPVIEQPVKTFYKVTFNSNEGTSVKTAEVESGAKVAKPADPVRKGYVFVGWCSDEALKNAFDFNTAITENITLYANWEAYTVENAAAAIAAALATASNAKNTDLLEKLGGFKIDVLSEFYLYDATSATNHFVADGTASQTLNAKYSNGNYTQYVGEEVNRYVDEDDQEQEHIARYYYAKAAEEGNDDVRYGMNFDKGSDEYDYEMIEAEEGLPDSLGSFNAMFSNAELYQEVSKVAAGEGYILTIQVDQTKALELMAENDPELDLDQLPDDLKAWLAQSDWLMTVTFDKTNQISRVEIAYRYAYADSSEVNAINERLVITRSNQNITEPTWVADAAAKVAEQNGSGE